MKIETFDMLCSSSSSLSELSSEPENGQEQHQTIKHIELERFFPLKFDAKNANIDARPLSDKMSNYSREITFKGIYKKIDILCTCVIPSNNAKCFDIMNKHEWKISERLMPCRYMATYINRFRTIRNSFINGIIEDESNSSVWYFVKPYYEKGTLAKYLMDKRNQSK